MTIPLVDEIKAGDWLASRTFGPAPEGAVLLHAPSQVFQAPGGGENQLVRTGMHLEGLGVPVRPFVPWTDRIDEARLLHLFGMSREGLELARVARARRVPVVLSTICWYEPRSLAALAGGRSRAALHLARWLLRRLAPRWPDWRRELLGLADAVVPNSIAEGNQLVGAFSARRETIHVVPNGVDPRFGEACPALFRERFGPEDFVLFVGRIEPRKDVLGLVRACKTAGLPLAVIGEAPPGRESYRRDCEREGGSAVRWLGGMDHDDSRLASAYAASRVVALASWFETPGLSALEGASAGSAVVVTPDGSAREYFGDMVGYARAGRPDELARALRDAWERGADPRLAGHVRARFPWSMVARRTAEVYDHVAG